MSRIATALVLLVAIAAGVALRIAPCRRDPAFQFLADGRYHERLTAQVVARGRLDPVDSLSSAPDGRRTARVLPVGLYYGAAAFHRSLAAAGRRDLHMNLALLMALCGALIALPAALAAWAAFGERGAAAVAAAIAVALPGHVLRTDGLQLRFDAPGVLLSILHLALVLAALGEPRARRRAWLAAGAALALVAAMGVWRVSVLVPGLELAAAVALLLWRGARPAAREQWIAIALVGGATLAAVALGALTGPHGGSSDYANIASILRVRLGLGALDPDAALMSTVIELRPLGFRRFLFGSEAFPWLGVVFAAAPLLLFWLRRDAATASGATPRARRVAAPAPEAALDRAPALFTLAVVAVGLAAAALLFQRGVGLVAPVVAIVAGGVIARAWDLRASRRRALRVALAIGVSAAALVAVAAGVRAGLADAQRLAPNLVRAIEIVRERSNPGEVVMCDWDAGYELQARAGRATAVDGLLESAENRRRIVALYGALMDTSATRLVTLCRSCDARWLLLPTSSAIYAMALVTGDPLAAWIARGEAVPRGALTDHLVVHLIEGDRVYPEPRRVEESGGYTVFAVEPR